MFTPVAFYCAIGHVTERSMASFEVDTIKKCMRPDCSEPVKGPFYSAEMAAEVRDLRAAAAAEAESAQA